MTKLFAGHISFVQLLTWTGQVFAPTARYWLSLVRCFAENCWRTAGTETLCWHCYWLLCRDVCVGSSVKIKGDWPEELRWWGNKHSLYQCWLHNLLPGYFFANALYFSFFFNLQQLPTWVFSSCLADVFCRISAWKDQLQSVAWVHHSKLL